MNSIKNKLILLIVSALILVCAIFGVVSYTQAKKILLNKTENSFLELTAEISKATLVLADAFKEYGFGATLVYLK